MINIEDVHIFNTLLTVQRAGVIDMFNVQLAIYYFASIKEYSTAEWICNNESLYRQGLLEGFKNMPTEIKNIVNKNSNPVNPRS